MKNHPLTLPVLALLTLLAPVYTTRLAGQARLVDDLNPGASGSFPSNLTVFGGLLYFSAYTPNTGRELWRTDGTNIVLVADINDTHTDLGGGVFVGNDSLPSWLTPFDHDL